MHFSGPQSGDRWELRGGSKKKLVFFLPAWLGRGTATGLPSNSCPLLHRNPLVHSTGPGQEEYDEVDRRGTVVPWPSPTPITQAEKKQFYFFQSPPSMLNGRLIPKKHIISLINFTQNTACYELPFWQNWRPNNHYPVPSWFQQKTFLSCWSYYWPYQVSSGWELRASRKHLFTGLFSNRMLTNRTLFWMVSGWCDLQPQVVWSVFVCGP
jgi:hypothetical protein